MSSEHYIPALVRAQLVEELLKTTSNCHFCGYFTSRRNEQHVDFVEYNGDNTDITLGNTLLVCKDCLTRRRKRPYSAYVTARFVEVSAELAVLTALQHAVLGRNAALELASTAKPKVIVAGSAEDTAAAAALADAWEDD